MLEIVILAAAVMIPAGGVLAYFLTRETSRLHGFDRRLAVSRIRALRVRPGRSATERRRGVGGDLVRELVLAAIRATSVLAPFGAKEREKLARMLRTAGLRHPDALSVYLNVKIATAIGGGIGVSFFGAGTEALAPYSFAAPVLFLVGAVVGGVLPEILIRSRSSGRKRRMSEALPNALDLLVMCLEAGQTFERALLTTAEELWVLEPGLSVELRTLEAELRVGSDHRTVLQDFLHRTEVEGLRDLATSLLQSERYGTPVAQSMRNIAENERTQRAARIEEKAQRLPVIMTMPMMLLVLPGTMLLMAGPAFLQALEALGSLG